MFRSGIFISAYSVLEITIVILVALYSIYRIPVLVISIHDEEQQFPTFTCVAATIVVEIPIPCCYGTSENDSYRNIK